MAAALGIMAFSVTENGASAPLVYLGAFMAGVGAGTVSSHASNVVAIALPEREASQSGGIQSTMRNVGQALGVALLGAVLVFGINRYGSKQCGGGCLHFASSVERLVGREHRPRQQPDLRGRDRGNLHDRRRAQGACVDRGHGAPRCGAHGICRRRGCGAGRPNHHAGNPGRRAKGSSGKRRVH